MKKVRVVIDTNVVISNLWLGKPRKVLNLWRDKKIEWVVSEEIIKEYLNVLGRFISENELNEWIDIFTDSTLVIILKPKCHLNIIEEDPDDNKFINCAIEGKVKYIVSGDKHLLKIKNIENIKILNCDSFLKEL